MSGTRRPGNGFYQYINQKWLKQAKIPSSLSEFGASEEIEIENMKQIKEILAKCESKLPDVGEIPKDGKSHIGFFQSIWKQRNYKNEEAFVKGILSEILDCNDIMQFAYVLGSLYKSGVPGIISVKIREEHKSPFFYRKTLIPANLTLSESYYLNKKKRLGPIWKAYEEYLTICSLELNAPYLMFAIEAETELAAILRNGASQDKLKELKGEDLVSWLPDFAWKEFMEGLGCSSHWRQEYWILQDPATLKRILQWFCRAEKEKIAAVLSLRLLNLYGEYLRPTIESAGFRLFETEMNGVTIKMSEERRFIADLSTVLPQALCSEFADIEYSSQKYKQIENLIERVKAAAVKTMSQNKSLNKRTTARAIEKIYRMKINIGTPKPEEIPKIPYYPDSIIHTSMSIMTSQNLESYTKSGHSIARDRLTYPCFIVNASYFEESNQFVIPWGILHSPFFIPHAPLGWNYGGIGATIGHEITHAFDIEGSNYDPRGHYKSWWTRKDRLHFKAKTRKMNSFFTKHTRFGKHLNGKKTLSENWADFGGLVIVLTALKDELKEKNASEQEIKEAIKLLFISYAVSWRDKMRKKKALYKIINSVHSLPEDRVDLILPHFQEWVDAFDIKESDPLFIPVGKRLTFF
jgi:predicted metalloendopeptidase